MAGVGIDTAHLFGSSYEGRRVLVTGHTGFEGSWLALWLHMLGAEVIGFSLPAQSERGLYSLGGLQHTISSVMGDIRCPSQLRAVFDTHRPELVFHLATQSSVQQGYARPSYTFETNVMGTVHVLECARACESTQAVVVVGSEKCYKKQDQLWGYRECDALGGIEPFGASAACAELVVAAYRRAFLFAESGKLVASVRAGDVIGGSDWSEEHLIPDCVRALEGARPIAVQKPMEVRYWQHVLEPLCGYLMLGSRLLAGEVLLADAWNFGPARDDAKTVREVVELLLSHWASGVWMDCSDLTAPRAPYPSRLDSEKARQRLGWRPLLDAQEAVALTADWYRRYRREDVFDLSARHIMDYMTRLPQTKTGL